MLGRRRECLCRSSSTSMGQRACTEYVDRPLYGYHCTFYISNTCILYNNYIRRIWNHIEARSKLSLGQKCSGLQHMCMYVKPLCAVLLCNRLTEVHAVYTEQATNVCSNNSAIVVIHKLSDVFSFLNICLQDWVCWQLQSIPIWHGTCGGGLPQVRLTES